MIPPPFLITKEPSWVCVVREISLTSGVIDVVLLSLYSSRLQLLPLTLSLECLGKTASIYSAWQTPAALPRGPSTSYVRTKLRQDLWGAGSREAALCDPHLQSWACSHVVRVVPRKTRKTRYKAEDEHPFAHSYHLETTGEKKTPCACSKFFLAQLSVSRGIKCRQ